MINSTISCLFKVIFYIKKKQIFITSQPDIIQVLCSQETKSGFCQMCVWSHRTSVSQKLWQVGNVWITEPLFAVTVNNYVKCHSEITHWHNLLLLYYKFGSLRIFVSSPRPSTNAQSLKQKASEYNMTTSNVRSIELFMSVELQVIKPVSCDINYEDMRQIPVIFLMSFILLTVCFVQTRHVQQYRAEGLWTLLWVVSQIFL